MIDDVPVSVSNTTPTETGFSASMVIAQDQPLDRIRRQLHELPPDQRLVLLREYLHELAAPPECDVCGERIETRYRKRLAKRDWLTNEVVRRYRACPTGCYTDTAILVTERSTYHAAD